MRWADIPWNPPLRQLRIFAAILFAALVVLGLLHGLSPREHLVLWLLWDVATWIALLGLLWPRIVRPVFVGWMVLVFPIGWSVSHVLLAVVYYGVVTPLGIGMRLSGRDVLHRRRPGGADSYWQPKSAAKGLQSYFQQF
jgi:hypothetical protein